MTLDPRRSQVLTGTDMCILLGAVPEDWGTPLDVYNHKVLGMMKSVDETESMEWGKRLEDAVAQKFHSRHPELVQVHDNVFVSNGIFGGTPDRVYLNPETNKYVLLEVKTTSDSPWQQPPDRVYIQTHTYHKAFLPPDNNEVELVCAALFNGNKYREYPIPVDNELLQQIQTVGEEFWFNHVSLRIPPPEGKSDESPVIPDDGSTMEVTDQESILLFNQYLIAKADKAKAEATLTPIADEIKAMFKAHRTLVFGSMKLDYITVPQPAKPDYKACWEWAKSVLPAEQTSPIERASSSKPSSYRRLSEPKEVK